MRRRTWQLWLCPLLLLALPNCQAAVELSAAKHRHLARQRANVHTGQLEEKQESSSSAQAASSSSGQTAASTESWLRTSYNRTLFFQPFHGLGNRLRALASAVVMAQEAGVGLQIVWQLQLPCPQCGPEAVAFMATWEQLFVLPELRLVNAFPGWDPDWGVEGTGAPKTRLSGQQPPAAAPPHNCTVRYVWDHDSFKAALAGGWETVAGQEVLCVQANNWLTLQEGSPEAGQFYRLLQPSPAVQQLVSDFQQKVDWADSQWICMHVRRTDLRIWAHGNAKVQDMISLQQYKDTLQSLLKLADRDWPTRIFLATDDPAAEEEIRSAFGTGKVTCYPKTAWGPATVEGAQQGLVDLWLLSSCPVLVGTYYSSYSQTARLISLPLYVQVGKPS